MSTISLSKSFVSVDHTTLSSDISRLLPGSLIQHISSAGRSKKAIEYGGSRHLYRVRHHSFYTVGNDKVTPMIILRDQTYPGAALSFQIGLFRLVCSNGLLGIAVADTTARIPHFNNRRSQLEVLADTFYDGFTRMEALIEEANRLTTVFVPSPEGVISNLDLSKALKEKLLSGIKADNVRPEDNIHTVWGLYNYVNETLFRRSRSVFAATEKDTSLVNQIIAINAA